MKQNIATPAEYAIFDPLIVIDKPDPLHDDALCVSMGNILDAQGTLSPEAFFLYMYISLCDNTESFRFFSSRFCDRFGFTDDMYANAYNELLEYSYLTTTTHNSDTLYFHDHPIDLPFLNQTNHSESDQDYWDDDEW